VAGNIKLLRIEQTDMLQGLIDEIPGVFSWANLENMNELAMDPFGGDSFVEWGGTDITDADQRFEWTKIATSGFFNATLEKRQAIMDDYWETQK